MASQCSLEGFHTPYSISLNPSTAGLSHERIKVAGVVFFLNSLAIAKEKFT
ncbi:hypothetical protein [Nostoc sp. UHCC 0251]|uniref:hypothetical protein n=1 Tax=Nostoc sp. UHCC 0251 TaxID=3110240 RepID=UPI002B1FAFCA|nr:hypothetical protein [Nostoc sp. UHCC 0251]MEA5625653.1 hypothetical protein [Nostoc sp. UHCC 0251]